MACVCSGAIAGRVCRQPGSLSQSTVSGDAGPSGTTVHAPAAAASRPVLAAVIVPGNAVFTDRVGGLASLL